MLSEGVTALEKSKIKRVSRALVYLHNHLHMPIKLLELAEVANFSQFHFHRLFKEFTGLTVNQYVIKLRIERVALLLRLSDNSINSIAFSSGYQSASSFGRAFRKYFLMSPSEYRDSNYFGLKAKNLNIYSNLVSTSPLPPIVIINLFEQKINVSVNGRHLSYVSNCPNGEGEGVSKSNCVRGAPFLEESLSKVRVCSQCSVAFSVRHKSKPIVSEIGEGEFAVFSFHGNLGEIKNDCLDVCNYWIPASSYSARKSLPFLIFHKYSFEAGEVCSADAFFPIQ